MLPITLCISFLLILKSASAGGYQGVIERLWLFYAYEIDGLNPPDQQTLGFKCVNPNGKSAWNVKTQTCDGKWQSCGEFHKVPRCNFNQLMEHLGGVQKKQKLVAGGDQNTKTPPIDETCKNYFNYRLKQPGGYAKSYPTYNFLRTTNGVFNDFVSKIGDAVVRAAPHRGQNQDIFGGFQEANDKVIEARRGDHGPFLIDTARREDWAKVQPGKTVPDIEIKTEPVGSGTRPVPDADGKQVEWRTVDWGATIEGSKLGRDETMSKIQEFNAKFYGGGQALDHHVVLNEFMNVGTKVRNCG